MFRLAFISFITVRLMICPLLCLGCDGDAQTIQAKPSHGCTCSDTDQVSCQGDRIPTPIDCPSDCPYPCDVDCLCEVNVAPDSNNRTASVGSLAVDFLPARFDKLAILRGFAPPGDEVTHRLDLESGRDYRIAHASFLL